MWEFIRECLPMRQTLLIGIYKEQYHGTVKRKIDSCLSDIFGGISEERRNYSI